MHSIDITTDINEAMRDIDGFFWKDVPFAMAGAMVDTMFDARRRIVESTYQKAFTVRNKAFPGRLWRVKVDGAKGSAMYRILRNELKTGGVAEILVAQQPLPSKGGGSPHREYMETHVTGGSKSSRGGRSIAIPVNIDRTGTGRIPAAKKPTRIRNKKGTFVRKGKGGTRVIVERQRNKELRVWYILSPSVKIDSRFRFYEDGIDTIERVFSGHFNSRMNQVVSKSRFTAK